MTTPQKDAEQLPEDTRDDPQTQPLSAKDLQAENASTSLDQPSS